MAEKSEEIQNEYDYYEKFYKGKRKVLKFDYHVFVYVNGVLQKNETYPYQEGDQVEIRYHIEELGIFGFDF